MIQSDQELEGANNRIAYFQRLLARLRVAATRDEFPLAAGAYNAEIEQMQTEVMDYLTRHVSEPPPTRAA